MNDAGGSANACSPSGMIRELGRNGYDGRVSVGI